METNQNGFAVAVAVALVAVAAALAGAGVWVYKSQIIKPKPVPAVPKTESQPVANEEETKIEGDEKEKRSAAEIAAEAETAIYQAYLSKIINTPNWIIYRNEEMGFEFSYPPEDGSNRLKDVDHNRWRGQDKLLLNALELNEYSVIVSIYDNSANLTVKEWLVANKENFKDQGCGLISTEAIGDWTDAKSITFDGVLGLQGRIGCCCGFGLTGTVLTKNKKIYFIETVWGTKENVIYEKILSTFKFFKPQEKEATSTADDLSLNKILPNFEFKNGSAAFPEGSIGANTEKRLILKKKEAGSFAAVGENNTLFLVMEEPTYHVEGMYHAYLGLIGPEGRLLTAPSVFPNSNGRHCDTCRETYIAEKDIGFVADDGMFTFYDCQGIKYALFSYLWRPNGGVCGSGGADLMKFENGKWKIVQKITTDILENNPIVGVTETKYEYGIIVDPQENKIVVNRNKTLPGNEEDFFKACEGSPYKTLNWNKATCRFE